MKETEKLEFNELSDEGLGEPIFDESGDSFGAISKIGKNMNIGKKGRHLEIKNDKYR